MLAEIDWGLFTGVAVVVLAIALLVYLAVYFMINVIVKLWKGK